MADPDLSPERLPVKSDLDRLLQQRGLDALVVVGPDGLTPVNADFRYFVGDAYVTGAVIKRRGQPPILLHTSMERDAARATGLEAVSTSRWPLKEIFEASESRAAARVELYRRIFEDLGVTGRVALAGVDDLAQALALWDALRAAVPGLVVVSEPDGGVLEEARLIKDADELRAIGDVAREACRVVEEVRDLLAESGVSDGGLAHEGEPLTVGRVREFARERLRVRGLEAPDGFIFATNRDAGVPHSKGDDAHLLAPGDVLLFDFFPRGAGGYFHDITRTWSLPPHRAEVRAVYEDVLACFTRILERVRPGVSTRELQHETCAFFENRGHPTIRQDPSATAGYVHSLGHGLGLEVHEGPQFPTFRAGRDTVLEPGMVVTIEPGLYYPDRDVGVRLEDTVVVTEDGARSLSPVSVALELPMAARAASA